MRPYEQAFVRAVLRHAALVHDDDTSSPECRRLAMVLADPALAGGASRRKWRRLAVRCAATVRSHDRQAPALVTDIGAGGLRLFDPHRLAPERGSRTIVRLRPNDGRRIDVPCEVVHASADGTVGLRFCGPPLVLHERRAA